MTALTRDPACYSGAGVPVAADVLDADNLCKALGGHGAAYSFVHSLADADFAAKDRAGARAIADAVTDAGLAQVIYLGATLPGPEPAATAEPPAPAPAPPPGVAIDFSAGDTEPEVRAKGTIEAMQHSASSG